MSTEYEKIIKDIVESWRPRLRDGATTDLEASATGICTRLTGNLNNCSTRVLEIVKMTAALLDPERLDVALQELRTRAEAQILAVGLQHSEASLIALAALSMSRFSVPTGETKPTTK